MIVVTPTDDKDLYLLSGNDYYLRIGSSDDLQNTFLHVERADIDVNNYSVESLDRFCLPDKVVERMDTIIKLQKAAGNVDFKTAVFMPSSKQDGEAVIDGYTLPSSKQNGEAVINGYTLPSSKQNGEVVINGYTESDTEYYERFGQPFSDTYIKYWNYSCSYVSEGSGASSKAAAIKDFLLTCAGLIKPVGAFQTGLSALQSLAAFLGVSEAQAGNGYRKIQTIVTYDAVNRITRWEYGGRPYVGTCKAWLNTNATQQTQDYIPAGVYQTMTTINQEMLSPHYDNEAYWLYYDYYNAASTVEGPIYMDIADQSYILV